MSRATETAVLAAAGLAGALLLLRYRKADGTTGELAGLAEVTLLPDPPKGPPQRLGPWKIPRAGEPYRAHFEAAERRYGVPALLLARQAYQESRFRADIIDGRTRSSAGAVGIMQVIPRYHPELGEAGALDPARAIDYAARFMRRLFDRFGSWSLALAAYNAGPSNVEKYRGVPPFAETQAYVRDITSDVGIA